jgi:hypothetical protein
MVLVPLSSTSLSEVCADLADGFYGLPRFELPEWLWERLPRTSPHNALAEIKRLGPALRLDEPTISHEWILFDAPGDFQLFLREDFFAIDGLNEEMLLGYHVDSNLSRRMLIRRGSIESLGDHVAGYHCNHSRTPTIYHGARLVTNDLDRFFFSVDEAELPTQRKIWGLVDAVLEEVPVRQRVGSHFAESLLAVTPGDAGPRTPSDALGAAFALTYDSGHVLPFIADSLAVSPTGVTIGYIGANGVLERMLSGLVSELGFGRPLVVARLEDRRSVDEVAGGADVVIVDLGVDASHADVASLATARDYEAARFPPGLGRAFAALERLVELERERLERGEHPRRIVLVNSATAFWDGYVQAHLECSYTTPHSRVRRATVKPLPDDDRATRTVLERARLLVRWGTRGDAGQGRLHVRLRQSVKISDLTDYGAFGDGWTCPDEVGVWTLGPRSDLAIALDECEGRAVLSLSIAAICVGPEESLRVEVIVNGTRVAARDLTQDESRFTVPAPRIRVSPRAVRAAKVVLPDVVTDRLRPLYRRLAAPVPIPLGTASRWRIELPAHVLAERQADLSFIIEEPRSPLAIGWSDSDDRSLGILLRSLTLEESDRYMLPEDSRSGSLGSSDVSLNH